MTSSFRTLASLCTQVSSGGTPSRADTSNFTTATGHKWVKSAELLDRRIWDTEEHISDQGLAGSSARYLPKHTVLVAMYGANVGQLGLLGVPATVNQAVCGLVVDPEQANAQYLLYALMHNRAKLIAQAKGAAQQNLNASLIKNFCIQIPPLLTQQRVADILSSYDDLIEVNRRRVAILEEMARRLFEEWFVHLRFPGHEAIPVYDEPAGPRPDGWVSGVVGDLLTLHRGYDLASNDRSLGDVPIMTGSGRNGTHNAYKIAAPGVVTGRSGTIGLVFLVHENFWPLNTALYVSSFTSVGPTFALFLLRQLDLRTRAGGAAVPTLNRNHVHALPALRPPVAVVEMYERLAAPMLQQAWSLAQQSERLADARDLLLPRLVSGELSVASAPERLLEAAD